MCALLFLQVGPVTVGDGGPSGRPKTGLCSSGVGSVHPSPSSLHEQACHKSSFCGLYTRCMSFKWPWCGWVLPAMSTVRWAVHILVAGHPGLHTQHIRQVAPAPKPSREASQA